MTERMMTSGHEILRENLRKRDYTNTLAAEALRVGLYTEDDVLRLRAGLMDALAVVIGYASKNESTSVRIDRANEYLACVLYNCDTYLLSLKNHEQAAEMLRSIRPEEMYNRGFAINQDHFREAKKLFANVRYTRLAEPTETYTRAIDKLLPRYLSDYDPRFNAHDKLYMSIPSLGIRGPFYMDETVRMLQKLLEIQKGRQSDVQL